MDELTVEFARLSIFSTPDSFNVENLTVSESSLNDLFLESQTDDVIDMGDELMKLFDGKFLFN